jgi:hypothetical protein
MFYDLKRLGITPDVFICALFGYSINIRICLVYDELFRSSPEKCIILNNKTNEICNIFIINWIVNGSFLSLFPHISTKTTLNICARTISTTLRSLLGLVNFMVSALGNISSLPLHSHSYGIWMPCRL